MSTRPPVLILGNGITALGVMRTCRRAGIKVYSLPATSGIDRHSRLYRPAPIRFGAEGLVPTNLAEYLSACELSSAVLMPCSDAWTLEAAALDGEMRQQFPASLAAPETIDKLINKAAFGRLLEATGVPHPLTRALGSVAELASLPESALAGAFLKPHDSQHFFARYGVKAFQVASPAEAAERLREIEEAGLQVLLQEYIPGPGSLHYLVDGFIDAGGRCSGIFTRRRLRMHPPDFGNSSYMVSVSQQEMAQAIDSVRTVLAAVAFRGIFSAEFKLDPRDGVFKLLEINARPWWYIEFTARCGVDVCTMAYRDALGLPVAEVTGQTVGARMVYPYYDYFACRDALRAGELSWGQWLHSWLGAQQPLFNWTDPGPAIFEAVMAIRGRLRRGRRKPLR